MADNLTPEEIDSNSVLKPSDVTDMQNALAVANDIEQRAIARGYIWMKMNNHKFLGYFRNSDGYAVMLKKHTLGNSKVEFLVCDEQGGGDWIPVKIPSHFLFEDNEETKEYAEYVRLSKKYSQ